MGIEDKTLKMILGIFFMTQTVEKLTRKKYANFLKNAENCTIS